MDTHLPENVTVVDGYTIASPFERIVAFLIDAVIYVLTFIAFYKLFHLIGLPTVGGLFATFLFVIRDNFTWLEYQSVGKKIMKLKVVRDNDGGKNLRFADSLKRNFIFLPSVLILFGKVFIYGAIMMVAFLIMVELYQMYTNSDFQRLGDQFAETMVIEKSF